MLGAVAILGKAGFDYLKRVLFRFIGRFAPPERVSRLRYRIGLVMFASSLLLGWVAPYVGGVIPGYRAHPVAYGLVGDLMLVASVMVLGGEFWDKVRALFVYDARVELPRS